MVRQKERKRSPGAVPKKNDHPLRQIPTDVLLKARSTLFSFGGALKSRQAAVDSRQDQTKQKQKQPIDKRNLNSKSDRLKIGKTDQEFEEVQNQRHKSRTPMREEYEDRRRKTRPMSMGPSSRRSVEYDDDALSRGSYPGEYFEQQRRYDSMEDMECLHPRLVLPVQCESLGGLDSLDGSERPRKKLSFREPEIVGGRSATLGRNVKHMGVNSLARNNRFSLPPDTIDFSLETMDSDLESQAMRIVRTVGQAFEVCHKLTSGSSEATASASGQEAGSVVSERASDISAKKEAVSDLCVSVVGSGAESAVASTSGVAGGSSAGGGSVGAGGSSEAGVSGGGGASGEGTETASASRPQKLDLLPPPPRKEGRRSPQRTIPTPSLNIPALSECLRNVELLATASSAECGRGSQMSITPLSTQHELQLLKEQLEQQSQQTRAAVAQLLLLRDQLAAEQAARCEAQARTHQLLVHNKELLDHITALVAHLQERERGSRHTPISVQQLTMVPQNTQSSQQPTPTIHLENSFSSLNNNDANFILDLFSQNSPTTSKQNLQNNNATPFNLYSTPQTPVNGHISLNNIYNEELVTRFQNMGSFPVNVDKLLSINTQNCNQQFFQNSNAFPNIPPLANNHSSWDLTRKLEPNEGMRNSSTNLNLNLVNQHSSVSSMQSQSSLFTPSPESTPEACSSDDGVPFIMPLSHAGTITTTDVNGRVRVIVPISPSESTTDIAKNNNNDEKLSMVTLNGTDDRGSTLRALPMGAPIITRTTSEKVPNRSDIMATMRSQWTRHTTK